MVRDRWVWYRIGMDGSGKVGTVKDMYGVGLWDGGVIIVLDRGDGLR